MAIVTFTITGVDSGYSNWSGTFQVDNLDTLVKDEDQVVITINSAGLFSFNSSKVLGWVDNDLSHNYITWRSQSYVTNPTQYPTGGESLDVWSFNLHRDVFTGQSEPLVYATWRDISSTDGSLSYDDLNEVKHTLAYDYDVPYASYYSRNGSIRFIRDIND
jgi:hypothetical protein